MSPGRGKHRSSDAKSTRLAAVDLGSNSFHMVVARLCGGKLKVLDRRRRVLRLAAGLDDAGDLIPAYCERALSALSEIAAGLEGIPPERVRGVGTDTLRVARNSEAFLGEAERVLGHEIEIISGEREARLIYGGVAHELPRDGCIRLVLDIGGGSTELILGRDDTVLLLRSFAMGCVSFSRRYFPDGILSRKAFSAAEAEAELLLKPLKEELADRSWSECWGASGSINAIARLQSRSRREEPSIRPQGLFDLRNHLSDAGNMAELKLPGLRRDRRPVLPGGLAILLALFRVLEIEILRPSPSALREGLLVELQGEINRA